MRSSQRHLRLFGDDGASTLKWGAAPVVNDLQLHSALALESRVLSGGVRLHSNERLFSIIPDGILVGIEQLAASSNTTLTSPPFLSVPSP
ncbi:hypothetical protein CA85_27640 [Allorhodopirellula solitaria]|uniref:Uncharacterized protein n=1 Tax=Allorhodopirellula solitaria TaxID=2527987 RepID=A0A5C5XTW0_9BACT|nr:hypothetical protein CA85_27640 [Allorhodopirellula solitaria]